MTVPEQWLEKAKYDVDTACAMLKAGRYFYVLFCCQQAVEKSLKAIIAQRTRKMPPRLHNLPDLAQIAGITVDQARTELMISLTNFYVQSRYPGTPDSVPLEGDREKAGETLRKTEEMLRWLCTFTKT